MLQERLVEATEDQVLASGPEEISIEKARELVQFFAEVSTSLDAERFLEGFTDDCIVRYGTFPEMRGKEKFRPFVDAMMSAKMKNFFCRKELRTINGNVLGVQWENDWVDADSGKRKTGRGLEFWILRGERIARWDAVFTMADAKS
ncbi:nuclear transport factor 2 family protein [Minwuia thermotolerans]|nr:nuclear transport factor 2 family protein [Minwuia thermotolerans]